MHGGAVILVHKRYIIIVGNMNNYLNYSFWHDNVILLAVIRAPMIATQIKMAHN